MINRLVSFALAQRFIVIVAMMCLAIWGIVSFQNLPIDAYPDLSPPRVQIVTQWPGHAAEEVERLITIPLEVEMNGIPKLDALRSISLYGLSSITMNFQYDTDPYFAREQAFERIPDAEVPSGVVPGISPLFSPSGLIYRYVLQSPDRSAQELKILQDWVLERRYRAIQGVADDSSLGGETMQYQVQIDPHRLMSYGVTVPQLVQQLANNNSNAGGGFYSQGGQFYYVRGLGLVKSLQDIGNIVIASHAGIPVSVHDVGTVAIGSAPRLGQFGYMKENDAVEGVILMRVGEQAQVILKKVEELTATLNASVMPPDVKIVPYYDRTELIEETTKTVERNLLRGMVLVLVILGIFLFSVRTALIVAVTIPFALLFSFICLDWAHIPANLLSIGAIDFGMIVDGAVVMVENIFRELASRHGQKYDLTAVIRTAAKDVERPIFYAIAVIIAGYLPIYALTGPSGRLFRPMADTMAFALVGALLCSLTLLPVLCAIFLRRHVKEPSVPIYERIVAGYGRLLGRQPAPPHGHAGVLRRGIRRVAPARAAHRRRVHAAPRRGVAVGPRDDAVHHFVRRGVEAGPQIRDILRSFPQVTTVANELGRPDDGTDPIGFFNDEYFVGLKPYNDPAWNGAVHTKAQLTDAIQAKLQAFPGIIFNYTQPAEDAVDESETGLKSSLAVKIFGSDLATLESKADAVQRVLTTVPGIAHVSLVRELGQPSLTIEPDREKLARYGLNVSDINTLIETAVGGAPATQVIQGERSFDLVVRLQEPYRQNMEAIKNILVATSDNQHLPLSQFADIKVSKGASFIYREGNSRFVGIQFSVEGRDLASAVADAEKKVAAAVQLPSGYTFDWGGEYQQYLAARSQMAVILPMTIVLIVLILFVLYGNLKFPVDHHVQRAGHGSGRRAARAEADRDELQRLVRIRIRRADGRCGADECHPLLVHQQAAPRRQGHHDRHATKHRCSGSARS